MTRAFGLSRFASAAPPAVSAACLLVTFITAPAATRAAAPFVSFAEPLGDARLGDQPNTSAADRRYSGGDYRAAEAGYRELISRYSEQPDLLTKLGWSLLMQGGYDDARAAFNKVDKWIGEPRKTPQGEVRNLLGLGQLALEEQRYEDAETFFRRVAKIDKKNSESQFGIAQSFFYENRLDDCAKACAEILKEPHGAHAQAALLSARVAAKTGVPDAKYRAIGIVNENSTKDYLHYMLGQMLEDLNDPAGARAQYKIALTIAPQRWLYQRALDALSKPAAPASTAPAVTAPPKLEAPPPSPPA